MEPAIAGDETGRNATATINAASEVIEAIDTLIAEAPSVWTYESDAVIEFLESLKEFAS